MNIHHVMYNCHAWHSWRGNVMTPYKKKTESTPVAVTQLFGFRKATAALLEFIGTTRVGRRPQEQEKDEEINRRDLA